MTEPPVTYITQQDADYAAMSDPERAWDTYWRLFAPANWLYWMGCDVMAVRILEAANDSP